MADDNTFGGFTNPAFVTPEQVAQQRQIVTQLLAGAQAPDTSKHWTGALAQALMGMRGQGMLNQANQMQRQGLQLGANAGQQAAAGNPMAAMVYGGQNPNPTSPQASNSGGSGDGNALKAAILMQESGNNPNIRSSYAGAQGPGQIMPQTFASIAKPGESINDATDNRNVSGRLLDKYMQDYGDPARAAVAYFSGPGNVAPPGSPTPWIKDKSDGTKTTSSYVSDVMRRMGGGQQMAQNGSGNLAEYYQNPWVPKELREAVRQGNTPVGVEDVRGRQGYTTTMGGPHLTPQGGGFEQGFRGNLGISAEGGVTVPVPFTAPGQGSSNQQGTGNPTGGLAETVAPYAQMGRDLATQNQFTKAWREPQVAAVTQDQNFLGQYPQIKQALGVIGNDLEQHGANLSMGPQSQTIQNIKKVAANFAPGLFSDAQIEGIAAGDSIHKMSGILGTLLARQIGNSGGTDYSQSLGQGQVPNMENSLQGAKALKSMIEQMTEQQYQLGLAAQKLPANQKMGIDPNFNYVSWKNDWYSKHPIINPITKNPITQDLSKYTTSVNEMQNSGGIKNKTDAEIKEFLKKKGINLGP